MKLINEMKKLFKLEMKKEKLKKKLKNFKIN